MFEHFIEFFGADKDALKDIESALFYGICKTLALPMPDIQRYIMLWSFLIPTNVSVVLPRLFSFGATPGCGKSVSGKLLNKFRGFPILQSGATGASIRNTLMSQKYGKTWLAELNENENFLAETKESHCGLICDDINHQQISLDQIRLSILKSGIDRSCSTISIANPGTGQNLEFDTFGLIALSSCWPLWSYPELFELKRRILIFKMANYKSFSDSEKEKNYAPENLDNLDFYDFRGFNLYEKFYTDERLKEFSKTLRSEYLKRQLRDSQLPTEIAFILSSLIVNGIILGNDMSVVIHIVEKYYQEIYLDCLDDTSALEKWITKYITESESHQIPPFEINSKDFMNELEKAFENGYICERKDKEKVKNILYRMGYKQTDSKDSNCRVLVWRRFA